MRLIVPLAFLVIVTLFLFINLGWWVHYYESTEDILPSDKNRGRQESTNNRQALDHVKENIKRENDEKQSTHHEASAQEVSRRKEVIREKQAAAAAEDEKLKIERYGLPSAQPLKQRKLPPANQKWTYHPGRSCQNYANDDAKTRTLEDSKIECFNNDACVAIECPAKRETDCTLRAHGNLVPYKHADCYLAEIGDDADKSIDGKRKIKLHSAYNALLKEYPFQAVRTNRGQTVNILSLIHI